MRQRPPITRLHQRIPAMHAAARPVVGTRTLKRLPIATPIRREPIERISAPAEPTFQPDPYQDYGRALTAEGGILVIYKDLDLRFRHTAWRLILWTVFTGLEALYLFRAHPIQNQWVMIVCLVLMAIVNWWIVATPVELYRRIEIRPDCLILDGADVFWSRFMENGFPRFHVDAEGNKIMCGTYGTRFIEYLTVRHFDGNDRMPEVVEAHVADAMIQLWTKPYHGA